MPASRAPRKTNWQRPTGSRPATEFAQSANQRLAASLREVPEPFTGAAGPCSKGMAGSHVRPRYARVADGYPHENHTQTAAAGFVVKRSNVAIGNFPGSTPPKINLHPGAIGFIIAFLAFIYRTFSQSVVTRKPHLFDTDVEYRTSRPGCFMGRRRRRALRRSDLR